MSHSANQERRGWRVFRRSRLVGVVLLVMMATGARAGPGTPPGLPPGVGLEQQLNAQVPLDATFRDENGAKVRLDDLVGSRPVILTLNYYRCPMLCTLVLNGVASCMRALPFEPGRDFDVVTISIDPAETPALAAAKQREYVRSYAARHADRAERARAGWHFLTGDEANIRRVADAVGFHYAYDAASGQFAHASGIILLTPAGRVSRYFYGVEYPARDVRLGLVEASQNRIGSPVDQLLLLCFHYDPASGKYGFVVFRALRIGGVLTVAAIAAFVGVMIRRERRMRAA